MKNLRVRIHPLLIILLVALLGRVLVGSLAGWNAPLSGDEIQYNQIAKNIASGNGFVEDTNPFFAGQKLYAWQAPIYPYTLAALYTLTNNSLIATKTFQILLSVATVYFVHRLALKIFSAREAIFAALIVALYPELITNTHLLLSETLFIFLLVLAFGLLLAGRRLRTLSLTGLAFGLAILTRGIVLYFAPISALWFALENIWLPRLNKQRVVGSIVFLFAVGLTLAPWIARNYATFHQFILLETKGGVNFWLGNSPNTPNDFIRNVWKVGVREPMLATLPNDEVARDHAGYALGLAYVAQRPLTFLARVPIKFADLYGFERNLLDGAEATRNKSGAGWNSPTKISADAISALAYMVLIITALLGLGFAPDDKFKLLFVSFILYFTAVHVVVFGDGRFHLPLIPFFALYASWAVVNRRTVRTRLQSWRGLLVGVCCIVFVLVWAHEIIAALNILTA